MNTTSKMRTTSKMKTTLKMKTTSKIGLHPQIFLSPPPPLKKLPEMFLMTSHLDSHTTTDVKLDMLSGVQPGNGIPHDKYNIRGIAHARTNRKDDIYMQRRLVQRLLYIDEARTALDIFRFAVFFF